MDTIESSPPAARADREARKQALPLAAQRYVNPDTGRLPADQVKAIYADLAREFGLEPSKVATSLPSSIRPTPAETLAYARSRRSAIAAERREQRMAAAEPVAVLPDPAEAVVEEPSPVARIDGVAVVPAALAEALEAFAARLTVGKDQEIAELREEIAALQADNQRLMAEVYKLERRLGQVREVLGNGHGPVRSLARPSVLEKG